MSPRRPSRRSRRRTPASGWRSRSESSLLLTVALGLSARLRRPLAALGVDPERFREVLRVRLVLELRSLDAFGASSIGLVLGVLLFFPAGLLSGVAAVVVDDPVPWVAGSTGFLMGMLAMLLGIQYVNLLMDPTDVAVAAPLPVSDRTLFAARLFHLALYVAGLSAIFAAGSVLVGVFGQPWWAVLLVYPVILLLATTLTVGLVAGLFALILRLVGPERFQRVTLWLQIGLLVLLMGGGQLPGLLRGTGAGAFFERLAAVPELRFLLPPFHYAGLFELCLGEATRANWIHAGLALSLPLVALWVTLRLASRHFVQALSGDLELGGAPGTRWPGGWTSWLGARTSRTRPERGAFGLAVACSRRDPIFLRQAVPGLIALPLMSLVVSLQVRDTTLGVGLAIGTLAAIAPAALEGMRYTRHDEARWLYRMTVAERPGELLRGGVRGVLLGMVLPVGALVALAALAIHGPARLPEVLVALELVALLVLGVAPRWNRDLPFTRPLRVGHANWEAMSLAFLVMFLIVPLLGAHFLLCWNTWTATLAAALLVPLVLRAWRRLDRVELAAGGLR